MKQTHTKKGNEFIRILIYAMKMCVCTGSHTITHRWYATSIGNQVENLFKRSINRFCALRASNRSQLHLQQQRATIYIFCARTWRKCEVGNGHTKCSHTIIIIGLCNNFKPEPEPEPKPNRKPKPMDNSTITIITQTLQIHCMEWNHHWQFCLYECNS